MVVIRDLDVFALLLARIRMFHRFVSARFRVGVTVKEKARVSILKLSSGDSSTHSGKIAPVMVEVDSVVVDV